MRKSRAKTYDDYHGYLAENVMVPFYKKRLTALQSMRLSDVLRRKNPYLFKAKNIETCEVLARGVVDAFLSSQEEGLFGNLLEGFAIYVAQTLHGGFKSSYRSVDLEFERAGHYYIVSIKSGIHWGNSDQISMMKSNFKQARVALREKGVVLPIVAVNGCIYGKDAKPLKSDADPDKTYFKYAGQDFWAFLSSDEELYRQIIVPIDAEAKKKDAAFRAAYTAKINELTADLSLNFLKQGQIDWIKLVDYVSGREAVTLRSAQQGQSADAQISAARVKTGRTKRVAKDIEL